MGNAAMGASDANAFRVALNGASHSGVRGGLPKGDCITYGGVFNEAVFPMKDDEANTTSTTGDLGILRPLVECAVEPAPDSSSSSSSAAAATTTTTPDRSGGWVAVALSADACDGDAVACRAGRSIHLSVCLDISGSMTDTFTTPKTEEELLAAQSKMDAAKQVVMSLVASMSPGDHFSLVTFNESARVVQPLTPVSALDKLAFHQAVSSLSPGGGTSLCAGYTQATSVFSPVKGPLIEHRIVFVTDMCDSNPDQEGTLFGLVGMNAERGIYTSIVGLGVDFNVAVTEKVTRVRGANYFCVFSPESFHKMMVSEFSFNFFPIAFDVQLRMSVDTSLYEIGEIFGNSLSERRDGQVIQQERWMYSTHCLFPEQLKQSVFTLLCAAQHYNATQLPEAALSQIVSYICPTVTCTISQVNTVFASPTRWHVSHTTAVRGSVLLVKIKSTPRPATSITGPSTLKVSVHYTGPADTPYGVSTLVTVPPGAPQNIIFSGEGVRKALWLYRYVNNIKTCLGAAETSTPPGSVPPESLAKLKAFIPQFSQEVTEHWPTDNVMLDAKSNLQLLCNLCDKKQKQEQCSLQ
ncbi:General vesicular transport factor p115 [Pelomyxa schiedti]|nr:General vesicular transport factor p115 [Pelomyxa schiedti]